MTMWVGEGDGSDALMSKGRAKVLSRALLLARDCIFWLGRPEGYHCQEERLEVQREWFFPLQQPSIHWDA